MQQMSILNTTMQFPNTVPSRLHCPYPKATTVSQLCFFIPLVSSNSDFSFSRPIVLTYLDHLPPNIMMHLLSIFKV